MIHHKLHASFVASGPGRILVTARIARPHAPGVLVVPAFAEEMNKSRRMLTELSLALAARGISTVSVDLSGTGDSEGEFSDATVDQWLVDLRTAAAWSREQGVELRALLGVRFGTLLAAEAVRRGMISMQRAVFWQPVTDGARMLDQFLRLRVAAQMMNSANKQSVAGLRETLRTSRLEVAGYELSPDLVAGIDALKLHPSAEGALAKVDWIEILRSADASIGVTSMRAIDTLKAAGSEVAVHTITSEPFWTSTEIVTSAALLTTSVDALSKVA